jgi:hypothetical protein
LYSSPNIVIVIIKEEWDMLQVQEKILVKGICRRDHLGAKDMSSIAY